MMSSSSIAQPTGNEYEAAQKKVMMPLLVTCAFVDSGTPPIDGWNSEEFASCPNTKQTLV